MYLDRTQHVMFRDNATHTQYVIPVQMKTLVRQMLHNQVGAALTINAENPGEAEMTLSS